MKPIEVMWIVVVVSWSAYEIVTISAGQRWSAAIISGALYCRELLSYLGRVAAAATDYVEPPGRHRYRRVLVAAIDERPYPFLRWSYRGPLAFRVTCTAQSLDHSIFLSPVLPAPIFRGCRESKIVYLEAEKWDYRELLICLDSN